MPQIVVAHQRKYNIFDSSTGKFVSPNGLTEAELTELMAELDPDKGLRALPRHIKRAKNYHHLTQTVAVNAAGDNNERLSVQQCLDIYLT